ncbi:hypothetical protein AB0E01_18795 [Nocardia vinacea]|uniref:hypothetical protein n=1 Tax=Nocardia vinacea TaxID=96468 RepID=UPI0033FDC067
MFDGILQCLALDEAVVHRELQRDLVHLGLGDVSECGAELAWVRNGVGESSSATLATVMMRRSRAIPLGREV